MKTHFTKILLALFFAITGLISCSKDDEVETGSDDKVEEGNQPEKKAAVLSIDKESLEFPEIGVNKESTLSFTISNSGNADLEITSVTVKGPNKADFSTNGEVVTVSSNSSTKIDVTLNSATKGNKLATVEIVTNVGTKSVILIATVKDSQVNLLNSNETFFKWLKAKGYDQNEDGKISVSEAEALTVLHINFHNTYDKPIQSLDGLGAFVNLKSLVVINAPFKTIDLKALTALTSVTFNGSAFTSLDLSKNTKLTHFRFKDMRRITELDFKNNSKLVYVVLYTDLEEGRGVLKKLNLANGNSSNLQLLESRHQSYECISFDKGYEFPIKTAGFAIEDRSVIKNDGTSCID